MNRYFKDETTGQEWIWDGRDMTTGSMDSIFFSPEELMDCIGIIEVDGYGSPIKPVEAYELTPAEADEIRGEKLQQAEADES